DLAAHPEIRSHPFLDSVYQQDLDDGSDLLQAADLLFDENPKRGISRRGIHVGHSENAHCGTSGGTDINGAFVTTSELSQDENSSACSRILVGERPEPGRKFPSMKAVVTSRR